MADKEHDDYRPPNPRWPTLPNPADLLLPLRKAEHCLSEQDGEDRAFTLAIAAANMPRATPEELRDTLATSQHADRRGLAGKEQHRRAVKATLGDITKEVSGDPSEDREAAYQAWRAAALREQEQRDNR